MTQADYVLSKLPDPDDTLRRLADLLHVPAKCRRRACRRERGCQGGYGPPCYFEHRPLFADPLADGLQEIRSYWTEQRESLRALLRR